MSAPQPLPVEANPLLATDGLPHFASVRADHVAPAIATVLDEARATLERVVATPPGSWDAVFGPLEALDERLTRAWNPVTHLNAVADSPALRAAYQAALPTLSAWQTELAQDARLYAAVRGLAARADALGLDATRRKVLTDRLRDFELAGVALPEADKARFKAAAEALSTLEARFEEQVLDATQAWTERVDDVALLRGLPADALERARERATADGHSGWTLTLDHPAYSAVLTHAEDRALRERVWTAYATRASDQGPQAGQHDNGPLMRDILALRHELATLTGFPDYASYALTTRMAGTPERVAEFLADLTRRVRPQAARELADLQAFAAAELGIAALAPWDIAFATERLRRARFELSQQELRPYFPVTRVMDGLFELLGEVYGLTFTPVPGVEVWHPSVVLHEVRDASGTPRGRLFVDLYARRAKRSGAWMDECLDRRRSATGLQLPVAHLVCNFPAPTARTPALLTHDEVLTLFHEMGHCLHHLLTTVEVGDAAGINGVAWDAVELPSQMHELFAWHPRVLRMVSAHHEDGRPLPEALLGRLIAARDFHAASMLLRQLEFATYDLRLHRGAPADPQATLAAVRAELGLLTRPAWDRFGNAFSHVFAGGYAAGYYGYLWAEVLASDAFGAFEEQGVLDRATGQRFMDEVLAVGGSREPGESFAAFRGRAPALDAFLRHHGIGSTTG
jgi:oligopeptidase A